MLAPLAVYVFNKISGCVEKMGEAPVKEDDMQAAIALACPKVDPGAIGKLIAQRRKLEARASPLATWPYLGRDIPLIKTRNAKILASRLLYYSAV